MQDIEKQETPRASGGPKTIATGTTPTSEDPIGPSAQKGLQKSTPPETDEALPVLSVASQRNLETGALDSMKLLQRSGNKLLTLLEATVSESDLDRGREGGVKVEAHRIETAVQVANALATTVQTQANLLKALASFK